MRILLTGATGFIGRRLAEALSKKGYDVYGLLRSDSFATDLPAHVTFVRGDLTNRTSLAQVLESTRPDIMAHLAAQTPVRFSFSSPTDYAQNNYIGTVNLINAVIETCPNLQQFVHASTAEVYRPKQGYIREEDPLFGSTPYGISKAAADFYVQMSGLAYQLPYTILRPTNTFGRPFELPEEARGYLVEKAIIQMLTQNESAFDGNPRPRRCWMHVEDHVAAYLKVIDNPRCVNEIFNVSPNNAQSVGQVVATIAELSGFNGEIKWGSCPRPYDPEELCLDGRRLSSLGWRPRYTLREALATTIEYWRKKLAPLILGVRRA